MSLKSFLLGRMNRAFARTDLPPRDDRGATHTVGDPDAALRPPPFAGRFASGRARAAPGLEHLGAYRPLIAAVREELERFVQSDLRLHLAIAEHDRYVLTSIAIESVGSDDSRERLARFAREFAPEQVKHYLAKEIIARLPNASAIDLSQFSGLRAPGEAQKQEAATGYEELIAELRSDAPEPAKAYEVTLLGRWAEKETRDAGTAEASRPAASEVTPLAGRGVAVDIEDAGGSRRADLALVVPGRRYVVGKDAGCDIVVDGVYASRRHCELWLDKGMWWATDCGSTNGIRVEPPAVGGLTRGSLLSSAGGDGKVLAVAPGARIVLSAFAQGEPGQYPRIALRAPEPAARNALSEATPVTPIVAPRRAGGGLTLTVRMASGAKTVGLTRDGTPFRIGRSRNQGLVIDWAHESVSGHHVDILEPGEAGARVVVHGDNGVVVDGAIHAAGAQFDWKVGETMLLGRTVHDEPECALTLSHDP